MNVVVTSHLHVCLYSAAGGKVNRQGLQHRTNIHPHSLNGGPHSSRRRIGGERVIGARWVMRATIILIVSRQRAQGRCFSGSSASRSLEDFSRIKLVTKNDLAPRKGLLLGLCFVAEGLQGRSGFIMCEQVSSDLYQKGRSSKDTKVDSAEAVKQESFGMFAEKGTDLKMKRPFRPR